MASNLAPDLTLPRTAARGRALPRARSFKVLLQWASLAVCVLVWHWVTTHRINLGIVNFENVPSPAQTLEAAWSLLHSPKLARHLASSLQRVAWGYAIAAIGGIVCGIAIGRASWARIALLPPLEVLRPIPAVAWIPLAILMFPSSELSMIFITFTGAFFPILLGTIHGTESVDARLIASARSLGAGRWGVLREVVLPGAAPGIVTGLAIGMGTSWFCLVTAEMISGQFGIGYYTWESYTVQRYPDIVVGMLIIGLLGMGSSALIRIIGQRLTPWRNPTGGRR
ncbi:MULTISPECIES: ABC transporter permease [Pandoraea]|uniref:ABC transporter permease n=1 Tax=Pandoraea TaxID=93217 RepID=UPI001F5E0DB0|nr:MULTISPECIES: ABC transporter permease [Pandoraea]MCI3206757.1 ABC transporter permease [Pandoraea sp. LA3]MDN4584785.1 ABC transporter permease [Pandoraea capi]